MQQLDGGVAATKLTSCCRRPACGQNTQRQAYRANPCRLQSWSRRSWHQHSANSNKHRSQGQAQAAVPAEAKAICLAALVILPAQFVAKDHGWQPPATCPSSRLTGTFFPDASLLGLVTTSFFPPVGA